MVEKLESGENGTKEMCTLIYSSVLNTGPTRSCRFVHLCGPMLDVDDGSWFPGPRTSWRPTIEAGSIGQLESLTYASLDGLHSIFELASTPPWGDVGNAG